MATTVTDRASGQVVARCKNLREARNYRRLRPSPGDYVLESDYIPRKAQRAYMHLPPRSGKQYQ